MMWLWILTLWPIILATSDLIISNDNLREFPANHRIAGVFQVSHVNYLNQLQYGFNASDARKVCHFLGVNIASKQQVDEALTHGLETCRYGWVDEHFVVIPRIVASVSCGRNQTGVVIWRAAVTQKFDVFCYNQSDMVTQLKDTLNDSLLTATELQKETHSRSEASTFSPFTTHQLKSTFSTPLTSLSLSSALTSDTSPYLSTGSPESVTELALSLGTTQPSMRAAAKALLITATCIILLSAVAFLGYLKWNKSCHLSWDVKQQEEYIETKEWTCVKTVEEPQAEPQEEDKQDEDNDVKVDITEKNTDEQD